MTRFETHKQEIQLESSYEDGGKFYVTAKALSKDFECETGRKALAKDVVRQPITWRHRHPIEEEHKHNHIYGRVEDSWVNPQDGFMMVKAEIYDHTQDHRDFIKDIEKRDFVKDPLGWSMHYRSYFNEKGVKYHWDVFELAGTPNPACPQCKTTKFGVEKMETKNEKEIDKTKSEEEKELEKAEKIEKAVETIKDLEAKLNAKSEDYEVLSTKIQKLESAVKVKDKELEDSSKAEKSLEERVLGMESEMNFLRDKKPILDKILELNPEIDEHELKWLRSEDTDYLNKRLEKENKDALKKPQIKELEASAEAAKVEKEKEDKKLEEVSLEQFTSQLEGFKQK